jgi:hypothetical protein
LALLTTSRSPSGLYSPVAVAWSMPLMSGNGRPSAPSGSSDQRLSVSAAMSTDQPSADITTARIVPACGSSVEGGTPESDGGLA